MSLARPAGGQRLSRGIETRDVGAIVQAGLALHPGSGVARSLNGALHKLGPRENVRVIFPFE